MPQSFIFFVVTFKFFLLMENFAFDLMIVTEKFDYQFWSNVLFFPFYK